MNAKLKSLDKIKSIAESLRKEGKRIVTTNGVFDLLHIGHIRYLQQARDLGDLLIVGINSDNSARKLKGNGRPINPQSERAEVLDALSSVDYICIFEEDMPFAFLDAVRPQVHVKGGDYSEDQLPEKELVEKNGGRVQIIELVEGHSTSDLINKIIKEFGK